MFAGLALAAAMTCQPIRGENALWANSKTRYVIFGEVHGSAEAPALFGDLACAAHESGRRVVVVVEAAETELDAIDRYIASDGGEAAKASFLRSPIWTFPMKDGRSSQAYFDLFDRLRSLKSAGNIVAVVAGKPILGAPSKTESDANAAMADRFRAASAIAPNALVLILVGNFHASKAVMEGAESVVPAAADLPTNETISLNLVAQGTSWNCRGASDCGPHALPGRPPQAREVKLGPGNLPNYDGEVDVGVPLTASRPAVP